MIVGNNITVLGNNYTTTRAFTWSLFGHFKVKSMLFKELKHISSFHGLLACLILYSYTNMYHSWVGHFGYFGKIKNGFFKSVSATNPPATAINPKTMYFLNCFIILIYIIFFLYCLLSKPCKMHTFVTKLGSFDCVAFTFLD